MTITTTSVTKEPTNGVSTDNTKGAQNFEPAKIKSFTLAKTITLGTVAIIAFFAFSSCARKAVFQVSPVVPAARGYVKTKRDSNKNFNVYVSLEDLAEPNRLTPPVHAYVVWLVTSDNITKNAGQVRTSTSLLSHTLKGSFETVSTTKPIRVFITAENDPAVQMPVGLMVMTTSGF